MEGIGAEVSQKIRSAIKAKLTEIGVYVDEELPDYVMVMVANKRSKEQMDDELRLFLGKHTPLFTTWLHQVLQKLQEVTVANKGVKRRMSEETKKKKKSKLDLSKKEIKKKIKIENEDDNIDVLKDKPKEKGKKDVAEETDNVSNKNLESSESAKKNKNEAIELNKEKKVSKTSNKDTSGPDRILKSQDDQHAEDANKPSNQIDDLDDEDCINIRTDGEMLDTAEEGVGDEITKNNNENNDSFSSKQSIKDNGKKRTTRQDNSVHKHKSKSENIDYENRHDKKLLPKINLSPPQHSSNDKVTDARELLNRKKAAKQSESRARAHSRSKSPQPKEKNYYNEGQNRKSSREEENDQRTKRDREIYSSKRKDEDRSAGRNRSPTRDRKRRDSSTEPPPKRVTRERPLRKRSNDRESAYGSKSSRDADSRKTGIDLHLKKFDAEERVRHSSGLSSRVVPRNPQPEEEVDTPVPSVVKVTQRPRRPPSQQPSSTLIMRAISEANKSLANVPQRPDSTQRSRKEPIFTRTLRKHERIPPEKIAVSITNPLALQNTGAKKRKEINEEKKECSSPLADDCQNSDKSSNHQSEVSSTEQANAASPKSNTDDNPKERKPNKEIGVESPHDTDAQEPILQIEADEDIIEGVYNESVEEGSDPQFVVTLNGYDPDGLFSHGELDLGEDGECEEWLRQQGDDDPRLTSTPAPSPSHRADRTDLLSPNVIMNTVAVNHSNLIEVEIMKPKTTERCKFWPACKLADKCTYYHPTKPCKVFPACKFGDACLYIHPQCKYNALCTRKDCVFAHTPAHTPSQPLVSKPKALYASSAVMTCKFYPNCTNINCQFVHPSRACRFGLYCTKKDCLFDHGQVAPVDKLKWTRVPPAT